MQEPSLHLFYGLRVFRCDDTHGLNDCHLCRYTIVAPGIFRPRSIIIATSLWCKDAVLFKRLYVFERLASAAFYSMNDRHLRFTVERKCGRVFLCKRNEIFYVTLCCSVCHVILVISHRADIEYIDCRRRRHRRQFRILLLHLP